MVEMILYVSCQDTDIQNQQMNDSVSSRILFNKMTCLMCF